MKIIAQILIFILGSAIIFGLYSGRPIIWIPPGLILIALAVLSKILWSKKYTKATQSINNHIEKLKSSGQKIKIDFENCEFKESSYSTEIVDERFSRFGHLNLDYGKVIGNEFTAQSLLVYHHKDGTEAEVFKQGFPCSADALKLYVLANSITLYVDRMDRGNYFFDLKNNDN